MLKSIRGYTIVLFVLLLMSFSVLYKDLIQPKANELNVKNVYKRLAVVCGTQQIPPLNIIDSKVVNAWTDGRSITITAGMLHMMKNNDELAMVLGHELGHVLNGDVDRGEQPIDPNYLEANADKFGAFIMMRAGFDPCKGKEILRTFKDNFGDDAAAQGHPNNAFRLDQLDLPQCH